MKKKDNVADTTTVNQAGLKQLLDAINTKFQEQAGKLAKYRSLLIVTADILDARGNDWDLKLAKKIREEL